MINSPIEEIKNKLDLVDVVGQYLKLQKTGANLRARCPFHAEKTPSFFVSPARQVWKCFGCGIGGDVFKFVMQIEGIEFPDALRLLAQKAGVKLERQDPELRTERKRLYEICELGARFYEKQLEASVLGKKAKDYLVGRKINENSIREFRLGYAPDEWRALSDFLVGKGYTREEIVKVGLAIQKEEATSNQQSAISHVYDRFRGRIMFPVFDLQGQVIGFGGRIAPWREDQIKNQKSPKQSLRDATGQAKIKNNENEDLLRKMDEPKYLNTPQTLIYDKSKVLYGLDKAKVEIRKNNACIMMEGYTDVILSWQEGIRHVVSSSGTALTSFQLKILKRYTENLYTAYDMDFAGDTATKRGIDLAQTQGFQIKIITLPQGKDPADIISEDPNLWERAYKEAKSILEFYFDTTFNTYDPKKVDGKLHICRVLLPVLKRIPNKIEQAHWVTTLSRRIETREDMIYEELKKISLQESGFLEQGVQEGEHNVTHVPKSRRTLLEERILSLALCEPKRCDFIFKKEIPFSSAPYAAIFEKLRAHKEIFSRDGKSDGGIASLARAMTPDEQRAWEQILVRSEFEEEELPTKDWEQEVELCIRQLSSFVLRDRLHAVALAIQREELHNNSAELERLTKEFSELSQRLIQIEVS